VEREIDDRYLELECGDRANAEQQNAVLFRHPQILYHLFEFGRTVICVHMDMAGDKWQVQNSVVLRTKTAHKQPKTPLS